MVNMPRSFYLGVAFILSTFSITLFISISHSYAAEPHREAQAITAACTTRYESGALTGTFTSADGGAVQQAIDAITETGIVKISGTCQGGQTINPPSFAQVAYITKNVQLLGGYNDTFTVYDPDLYTTTLSANNDGRIIFITRTATLTPVVTLADLIVTDGLIPYSASVPSGQLSGGGIFVYRSTVYISNSQIVSNTAIQFGGGIHAISSQLFMTDTEVAYNTSAESGGGINTIKTGAHIGVSFITHSSIHHNQAGDGFGLDHGGGLHTNLDLNLINSTFSYNQADQKGGGIFAASDSYLSNVTIAYNTAITGGGLFNSQSFAYITNTLFADNVASLTGNNCHFFHDASPTLNYIFDTESSCAVSATNSISNVVANIGPLSVISGRTPVHPLLSTSAAIDGGDPSGCHAYFNTPAETASNPFYTTDGQLLEDDQVGRPRTASNCDIGAYEYGSAGSVISCTPPVITIAEGSGEVTITLDTTGDFDIWRSDEPYLDVTTAGTATFMVSSDNSYTDNTIVVGTNYYYVARPTGCTDAAGASNHVGIFNFDLEPGT